MGWQDAPVIKETPSWASAPAVEQQQSFKSAPAIDPDASTKRFLDFLAQAEGAYYNSVVGGGTFGDFSKHPRITGLVTQDGPSSAAGRYQITKSTYDTVAPGLGIKDFSPESQDKIAVELIRRRGALADVQSGNYEAAIKKLGGEWASLPTSPYSQSKRSWDWVNKTLGTNGSGYNQFAPIRNDIDPKSLNNDQDWLKASALMYQMWERKPYQGSPNDLAEWGKESMSNFNYNMVDMAQIAYAVSHASQEEKEAFLYMMDTYDNTNVSGAGAWRATKAIATDPTNLIGVGTLGVGTAAKFLGKNAAKAGIRKLVLESMARTGIAAGMEGGIYAATDSTIRQGVEVSAGRRESIDLSKVGVDAAVGATAGLVLGTAADAAVSKIYAAVRGTPKAVGKAVEDAVPNVSGVTRESTQVAAAAEAKAEVKAGATLAEAVPEAKLGSTLTPTELEVAMARKQEGRLAEDVAPNLSGKTDVPLDIPPANTGLRSTPMSMDNLSKLGEHVAEQLRPLGNEDLTKALEQLRTGSMPLEESRIVARGVQMYADELQIQKAEIIKAINAKPESPDVPALSAKLAALDERLAPLQMADDAFGSMAGSILRQRQEGLPGVTGVTVESIMKEKGITKDKAQQVWAEMVTQAESTGQAQKIAQAYDGKAAVALENGNLAEAAKLTAQKYREIAGLTEAMTPNSASLVQKLNELAISNVFSPKTIIVNAVPSGIKTIVIPALKLFMGNPLAIEERKAAAASYSAMRSTFGGALQAAKAGFKYEQALLTRDGTRLVEGELALKGKLGGALRIFPRILNATDEFLSHLNYNSFVAGRAAGEAATTAVAKGVSGKELDEVVQKAVDKALKDAYKSTRADDLVQPIINKGVNLGLTGEDLFKWVEKEAMKNPEALKKGTDEEALHFVRDVLYKREFSGTNAASQAAKWYEDGTRKFPSVKLIIGQLFFRTPIRVFEEGIRLTPGLQIIAPGFMKDLSGANGTMRQVKAQAEAMSSLAIAGTVLSLYSQGRITGDGSYSDYRQQKLRGDSALPAPYTIKMSDGSTWSYRGFDPLATPIKIMVNAMERMDKLRIREAQGEFVDEKAYKYPLAAITVAAGAISQAIRDASLVEGVNNTIKLLEDMADPEKKEDAIVKMLGDKLSMLVPHTLDKIAKDNDPSIHDPQSFWQVVQEKLLRPIGQEVPGVKTSNSYDVLGNVRRISDTGSLWNVFSTTSVEEAGKGMSPEGQFVLAELDRLTRVTGATFTPPLKHRDLGDMDLRTVMASDKKSTLYDVWQQSYKALNPDQILYPIMAAPMPDGTFKFKAARVDAVQQTVKQLQDAAFYQMMSKEQQVVDALIKHELLKANSEAGLFDSKRPY